VDARAHLDAVGPKRDERDGEADETPLRRETPEDLDREPQEDGEQGNGEDLDPAGRRAEVGQLEEQEWTRSEVVIEGWVVADQTARRGRADAVLGDVLNVVELLDPIVVALPEVGVSEIGEVDREGRDQQRDHWRVEAGAAIREGTEAHEEDGAHCTRHDRVEPRAGGDEGECGQSGEQTERHTGARTNAHEGSDDAMKHTWKSAGPCRHRT